jgi:hypothetical protein
MAGNLERKLSPCRPPPTPTEVTLHPDLSPLFAGVLFFGLCTAGLFTGGHHWIGGVALLCTAACAAGTLWAGFNPQCRLRLSPDGISFATIQSAFFYRWSDIAGFHIFQRRGCGSRAGIMINFTPEFKSRLRAQRSKKGTRRPARRLPFGYGMPAEELCDVLEKWRRHYSEVRPA